MREKDELKGMQSNLLLRIFEHQGKLFWGVVATPLEN